MPLVQIEAKYKMLAQIFSEQVGGGPTAYVL